MDRRVLGLNVRKARERANLTQKQLAQEIGVTHPTVNRLENGKQNISLDILGKISQRLDVPTYSLFSKSPLVPYPTVRDEHLAAARASSAFVGIKYFENPLVCGPGYDLLETPPDGYLPFLKEHLPRGVDAEPDRVIAFPAAGVSMKPTINPGSIVWIDRRDIQPRDQEIYAFWLPETNAVTVKRLVRFNRKRYCIIDGDNRNEEDRRSEELRDFPLVIDCREIEAAGNHWPIRGRVIWTLNRLVEEPGL